MKLILLPGLHGNGELFKPVVQHLNCPWQIVELPDDGYQDVYSLSQVISNQLPDEPIALLAESFSGCLIPHIVLTNNKNIKGIIFIASFITCPNYFYLHICRLMPDFFLHRLWLIKVVIRTLFLNGSSDQTLLETCSQVVLKTSVKTLKARVNILLNIKRPATKFQIPAVYIQAKDDRVLGSGCRNEIMRFFAAKQVLVDGPHFLLQANPKQGAKTIGEALNTIQVGSDQLSRQ
jgi:alpha-beta hydrolase superfamily lysophospholipase